MDLVGGQDSMGRVGSLGIVPGQPFLDTCLRLRAGLEGMQIDAFVFEGPPQALDHAVADPAASAIHDEVS